MRLKRLISCLLSAALLAGLLVFPPASASGSGGFSDISDSTVADAAEMLRLLGVVDGTGGGAFNPGGTLSRAEFCKMTVEIMGRGAEAQPHHLHRCGPHLLGQGLREPGLLHHHRRHRW